MLETNGGLPVVTLTKTSGTISKASRANSKNKPSPPTQQESTVNFAECRAQFYYQPKKSPQHNFET